MGDMLMILSHTKKKEETVFTCSLCKKKIKDFHFMKYRQEDLFLCDKCNNKFDKNKVYYTIKKDVIK